MSVLISALQAGHEIFTCNKAGIFMRTTYATNTLVGVVLVLQS